MVNNFTKTATFSYTVFGVCFGFCFPIFSILMDMLVFKKMSYAWDSIVFLHITNPLHFVIDTAPIFLGLAFGIAGYKQDKAVDYHKQINVLQQKTLQALQANEKIIREQNTVLEGTVSIRTAELLETNEELKQIIEELHATMELTNLQKDRIEAQNRNITASIRYGKTIQQTILPTQEELLISFSDIFAIYKPKDIVSGDFYWSLRTEKYTFFALADCTGHGVPGGFMSMLGSAILNSAITKNNLLEPDAILDYLHIEVRKAVKKNENSNNDGMDIALCRFDNNKSVTPNMVFVGAKNNVLHYKNIESKIIKIEGDRQSIGADSGIARIPYNLQAVTLQKNDVLYFYTDGVIDQANEARKRFGSKKLLELLEKNCKLSMEEQQQTYYQAIKNYQGKEMQRDDISLVALKW